MMDASTVLMFATGVAVLVFFLVVATALMRIDPLLESIGAEGNSLLAKLRFGLRAIEQETSHLPAAVPRINAGLGAIATGLTGVGVSLGGLAAALQAPPGEADGRRP